MIWDTKTVTGVLAITLILVQFLFHKWRCKDNKEVIGSIEKGIASFSEHVDRTRDIKTIVSEVQITLTRDTEVRAELIKLTHTVALTQKHIARLLERQEDRVDSSMTHIEELIIEHRDSCKAQYHALDKQLSRRETI